MYIGILEKESKKKKSIIFAIKLSFFSAKQNDSIEIKYNKYCFVQYLVVILKIIIYCHSHRNSRSHCHKTGAVGFRKTSLEANFPPNAYLYRIFRIVDPGLTTTYIFKVLVFYTMQSSIVNIDTKMQVFYDRKNSRLQTLLKIIICSHTRIFMNDIDNTVLRYIYVRVSTISYKFFLVIQNHILDDLLFLSRATTVGHPLYRLGCLYDLFESFQYLLCLTQSSDKTHQAIFYFDLHRHIFCYFSASKSFLSRSSK